MMDQIATFHTHFGALCFQKRLTTLGDRPRMMPVPRSLSASCGTCVRFAQEFCAETMVDEDLDGVYTLEGKQYRQIFHNTEP